MTTVRDLSEAASRAKTYTLIVGIPISKDSAKAWLRIQGAKQIAKEGQ